MAKKPKQDDMLTAVSHDAEVVEEVYPADTAVEYTDVTELETSGLEPAPAGDDGDEEPAPESAEAELDGEIPPELRGKSSAELARMYREAQSLIGRQGQELGELRRLSDVAIKRALERPAAPAQPAAPAEPKVDEVDFFTDPKKAVEAAIATHPLLKQLQGAARQMAVNEIVRTRQTAQAAFAKAHPDFEQVMADPAFRQWVGESKVRQALLHRAHAQWDFDAGNEVFGLWKQIRGVKTPNPAGKTAAAAATRAARKTAAVPGGGSAGAKPAGTDASGGKIFRRAEIIRLMQDDPARYEALSDEILQAYKDGRVR